MTGPAAGRRAPPRPRFTARAAVLAIVICAIAMSLAYPVREYLAQHREIVQLTAQRRQLDAQLRHLAAQHRELASPAFIERQAADRLHMCLPRQTCYVIIGARRRTVRSAARSAIPWYRRVWSSVQQADRGPAR